MNNEIPEDERIDVSALMTDEFQNLIAELEQRENQLEQRFLRPESKIQKLQFDLMALSEDYQAFKRTHNL